MTKPVRPILWIPGPTEVRPEILAECSRPMIGHRSKAMTVLQERLDPHLKLAFGLADGSDASVAVHTCAGTGLMESSLLGVGPRVLCVVNGSFSKRFHEIAVALGKQAVKLSAPMGSQVPFAQIEQALSQQGPFDALTIVSNETSTGVRTPLSELAALTRKFRETMVLVDFVSYIAGAPIDFDEHGFDFGFAGIQKALALPPGLTVACASRRYLEQAKTRQSRGFYLDPVKVFAGHAERATMATPAISLYYALAQELEDISAGVTLPASQKGKTGRAAWQARFDEHTRMQQVTEAWAASNGLELLPAPALRSTTISCIQAGDLDVPAFLAAIKARGHELGNGYGDLKDKTFRIGHMGDHTESRLAEMLQLADDAIAEVRGARARS
ncbi:MAG: alanine--glyoxylate aminotransferase family protein [Planctomycetes bacterium]|nr:alanine--glyoxylate aminotransferase family protein [Planctomycetota bacterium]